MDIPRSSSKSRIRRWVGLAIVAIVVLVGLVGTVASRAAARNSVPRAEGREIWTEHVKRGTLVRQVPVQGLLVPERVQWLSATTAARVSRILVRSGAAVEPETVVLVLQNAELELAALEADRQAASAQTALIQLDVSTKTQGTQQEGTLAAVRADWLSADMHAGAAEKLAPRGLISELDRRDVQEKASGLRNRLDAEERRMQALHTGRDALLAAQRAELERLREIAKFRKTQLAALEIRAGIRGVVQDIPLENGQWVAIGTLLAKVAEPDRLKAELKVSEAQAKDVHKGLSATLQLAGSPIRGHVERIDPSVIAGAVKLDVVFDEALPAGARSDQTVTGFVEIETLRDALFVARPVGAQDGATTGMFRIDPDGIHATRTTVRLGKGSVREIEILGGLREGDEVVVSDVSPWASDERIRIR